MATIKLRIKKQQVLSDGTHPIVLQLIFNRKKRIINTGHSCTLNQWNHQENIVNRRYPNSVNLNNVLRGKLNEAERIMLDLEGSNKSYTIDDLVDSISGKKYDIRAFKYSDTVIAKLKKEKKYGNADVYQTCLNAFKTFRNERDLEFADIDYKMIRDFEASLNERGVKVNTISNYMRTLRAIINRAIKEGVAPETAYPFKHYKIKNEKTQKRAISKDDINKIRDLELQEGSPLMLARDIFMFSFYMQGMNLVDIINLKVSDINKDRVQYKRKKTKQLFSVRLTEPSMAIIKKYNDLTNPKSNIFHTPLDRRNPHLSYQNFKRWINGRLKKIAEKAELNVPLTTYVARHSWATIAKREGIPTAVISEGLGHDSENTTQIYLDSFDNKVLDDANVIITG
ncbi:phage integrase SAM-like domain-containing protein [Bacteroidota bacterium]